jgi:hypothetical protein
MHNVFVVSILNTTTGTRGRPQAVYTRHEDAQDFARAMRERQHVYEAWLDAEPEGVPWEDPRYRAWVEAEPEEPEYVAEHQRWCVDMTALDIPLALV